MNCCYFVSPPQQCPSFGSDCCTVQQEQGHERKRETMLERQGIWMHPKKPSPRTHHEIFYRPPETKTLWRPKPVVCPQVPIQICVTVDTQGPFLSSHSNLNMNDGKIVRKVLWMTDSKWYDENRGPILKIKGRKKVETLLTYKEFLKLGEGGEPIEAKMEDYSEFYPEVEDLFVNDDMEPFATTTKCKQIKSITINNEGTSAVRYQFLRSPPTRALRKILGRPGSIINLRHHKTPKDNPFFWKDTSFEFHFRELPGVILPGQSVEFPITFRPRSTGYFHEKLYLLTHPRLSDEDDKIYNIRLSGICMEPDCPLPHSKSPMLGKEATPTVEKMARKIKSKMLHQEAMDSLNSILDNVLYEKKAPKSTLPFGKVTVEKIFYTHNRDLYYHYGPAEKSLELVRDLVHLLVPKERIIGNENVCPLSIKSLYSEIARNPIPIPIPISSPSPNPTSSKQSRFATNFKEPETEEKLEKLAESNRTLVKQRVFAWPSIDNRIYSSCYATMVAVMDEIVARIENVDFDANNPDLDKVLRAEIKDKLVKKKTRAERRRIRNERSRTKFLKRQLQNEDEEEDENEEFADFTYGKMEKNINDPTQKASTNRDGTAETQNSSERTTSSKMSGGGDTFEYGSNFGEMEGEDGELKQFPQIIPKPQQPKPVIEITDEEISNELAELKTRKVKQGKRVLFETLFGCGVERMMSVVDSFRNMYDYKPSDVIRKAEAPTCNT